MTSKQWEFMFYLNSSNGGYTLGLVMDNKLEDRVNELNKRVEKLEITPDVDLPRHLDC